MGCLYQCPYRIGVCFSSTQTDRVRFKAMLTT
ncbi:hypothetical protein phiOC_p278 [Ochrobactrum phage vB_OspM_OC]|nr:hypothetical protein phiOC_p278 [Ochrobactrum phage vB_OspM_OC]